ncbi:DUF3606 domain-containing protein [Pedobacter hartonius]|uniref:DUF3606 domain-containing protein n=1 Tax=Pedobacter hartonius TaxID=425514 RepID=A0A1H4HBU0_9SPHI|nr:DUF3606 domain-containing protein [Pedobacter hartonius]SEB19165.1 Protein of unknown function [Pedobacter hartonius]
MLRHSYYDRDEMRLKDRKWINLQEYYDVEYWSKKFGITPELLQLAVKNSGTTAAEEVEQYIRNKYVFK